MNDVKLLYRTTQFPSRKPRETTTVATGNFTSFSALFLTTLATVSSNKVSLGQCRNSRIENQSLEYFEATIQRFRKMVTVRLINQEKDYFTPWTKKSGPSLSILGPPIPANKETDFGTRFWPDFWLKFRPLPAIFRAIGIALDTHQLPVRVAVHGHCSKGALCPNAIPYLSRALRRARIPIRLSFDPPTDFAYCAIFKFDRFESLDRTQTHICRTSYF
ncbi:unnamed protein product [Prunus armeniaca]